MASRNISTSAATTTLSQWIMAMQKTVAPTVQGRSKRSWPRFSGRRDACRTVGEDAGATDFRRLLLSRAGSDRNWPRDSVMEGWAEFRAAFATPRMPLQY